MFSALKTVLEIWEGDKPNFKIMIAGMITTLTLVSSPFLGIAADVTKEHVQNLLNPTISNEISQPITLQSFLSDYFADTPVLYEIARCESTFRHYNSKGDVLRGKVNKFDIGVMQINELYHLDKAKELGLDIYSLEGNIAFAKYLYEKYGSKPWVSSSKCWSSVAGSKDNAREIAMR